MQPKSILAGALSCLILASCGETPPPAPQGPQPGSDLLIQIVAAETDGACSAYFSAYAEPASGLARVNIDYIWSNGSMGGSGLGMVDRDGDGILDGANDYSAQSFDIPCNEVTLRLRPTTCQNETADAMACPPIRIEGQEAFGSFEQTAF